MQLGTERGQDRAGPAEAGDWVERIAPKEASLRDLLASPRPGRQIAGYVVAIVGVGFLIAVMLPFRSDLSLLTKGLGFLVVVVAAAATGGLGPGVVASVLGFIFLNFFFIPPFDTFVIADPENVVLIFVFLGFSVLVSALIARATSRAEAAEAREGELRALQELSRDLVVFGPGRETYETLLTRVVHLFGFNAGGLFVQETAEMRGLEELVVVGAGPGELRPEWDPRSTEPAPERLPLNVGRRNLGLIVLKGDRPPLTPVESRILRSFCDQLALVLERDRLLRAATEADVYRQGERMRQSLLAAVSHDLRSPLAAIKASVTDLLDPEVDRPEADRRDVLRTIDRESDRLNALIADLLDISRIEAGALKARIEGIDLRDFLPTCVSGFHRERPGVRVDLRIQPDGEVVLADRAFLERVVANLLSNAGRAGEQTGADTIGLEAKPENGRTTVRVVDHGPGVAQTAKEQLFYPFYRLEQRNPRLGTGLGLAISKGFLEAMDGEIWVEDTPGGGATFAFSLPLRSDRSEA